MSPALDLLTGLAASTGREVSSAMAIAADGGKVCALLCTWSGLVAEAPASPAPGIRASERVSWPRTLLLMPSAALDEMHAEAGAAAWAMGAWDLSINIWPARECRVTAHVPWALGDDDLDDIHGGVEPIRLAAERGGMVQWTWKPIAYGSGLRRRRWQAEDATLKADGTRAIDKTPRLGAVPTIGDEAGQLTIRLGRRP